MKYNWRGKGRDERMISENLKKAILERFIIRSRRRAFLVEEIHGQR
jgi:hypothetical protein